MIRWQHDRSCLKPKVVNHGPNSSRRKVDFLACSSEQRKRGYEGFLGFADCRFLKVRKCRVKRFVNQRSDLVRCLWVHVNQPLLVVAKSVQSFLGWRTLA